MNKKIKVLSVLLIICSTLFLFAMFISNSKNFNSMLKASVNGTTEETNEILLAARNYAIDNMDSLKEENIISIKELVEKKYLTGNEINPVTNLEYDNTERIVIKITNGEIEDIYMLNNLFKNIFNCNDICYIENNNYIAFNNEVYRILKIDKEGNIYITNNDTKRINKDDLVDSFKRIYNSLDKRIVNNVVSLSDSDINKTSIIEIEDNIVVNSATGYKLYNIDTNSLSEINTNKVNIYPLIVLKNDITYETGDGSKFNPYILGE